MQRQRTHNIDDVQAQCWELDCVTLRTLMRTCRSKLITVRTEMTHNVCVSSSSSSQRRRWLTQKLPRVTRSSWALTSPTLQGHHRPHFLLVSVSIAIIWSILVISAHLILQVFLAKRKDVLVCVYVYPASRYIRYFDLHFANIDK